MFFPTYHGRTVVLSFRARFSVPSTYHHRFHLPPLRQGRRTVVMPYFRQGSFLPGFVRPVCVVQVLSTSPAFAAARKICFIFPAYVAVYKAFLLDLSALGIPVFSASSLSYALRIASVPAVHFRTRAFLSVFL